VSIISNQINGVAHATGPATAVNCIILFIPLPKPRLPSPNPSAMLVALLPGQIQPDDRMMHPPLESS
jgi:hypothetical protein